MSKSLQYLIVVISIASIFFSLYVIYQGQKVMDALGGVVIGVSLLGVLYFDNYKKKE